MYWTTGRQATTHFNRTGLLSTFWSRLLFGLVCRGRTCGISRFMNRFGLRDVYFGSLVSRPFPIKSLFVCFRLAFWFIPALARMTLDVNADIASQARVCVIKASWIHSPLSIVSPECTCLRGHSGSDRFVSFRSPFSS